MKTLYKSWILVGLLAVLASCATAGSSGLTSPAGVVVKVDNYTAQTTIGIATEIYLSVANATDQEMRDLTLTVAANPPDGLGLPYTELPIESIGPNHTWSPPQPFMVTGRQPERVTLFFIVSQDGKVLSKDYTIVSIGTEREHNHHMFVNNP